MSKILFIRTSTPIRNWMTSPPLGLLYLASALRSRLEPRPQIEILNTVFFRNPLKIIRKKIEEFNPDVIGLSVLTCEDRFMRQIAGMSKQISPQTPVVVGGPHGTIFYRHILPDSNIDWVVVGEGERSFVDLVNSLQAGGGGRGIPGVAGRSPAGETEFVPRPSEVNENIDDLPFPAWDLIDLDEYRKHPCMNRSMGKGRYMPVFTSRACPFDCIYCHSIFGKRFRARSPENVSAEMEILYQQYRVREFQFFDDCFNLDLSRAKKIGELIATRTPGARLSFPNGIRSDRADAEFLDIFRRAGAYTLTLAVETASPRLQKLIGKNLNLDKVRETMEAADRRGYLLQGFFMLGFPTETEAEMEATMAFAENSPLLFATFFRVISFPGTRLAEMVRQPGSEKLSECCYHSRGTETDLTGNHLNLDRIRKRAYTRFYLRHPRRITRALALAPNPAGLLKHLASFSFQTLI